MEYQGFQVYLLLLIMNKTNVKEQSNIKSNSIVVNILLRGDN